MSYIHFTPDERKTLFELLNKNYSLRTIAAYLGRSASTVSREISRNSVNGRYSPYKANRLAEQRKNSRSLRSIIPGSKQWNYVIEKLNLFWTPEQIAGRWKKDFPSEKPIHFSTIYRYIHRGYLPEIDSKSHLRRRGNHPKPDKSTYNSVKPDRLITDWPDVVKERLRVGDWEGDSILGGVGKGLALTLVDRKSRFLISVISLTKKASENAALISKALMNHPVNSISFDNGVEFAEFHTIEKNLNTDVYFAEPHKPWQRGTNENTNGILRFFFEKGCDFREVSEEEFQNVIDLINNRPRKCLGWRTPAEVYSESVALT